MKGFLIFLGFIALLVFLAVVSYHADENRREEINTWARNKNFAVLSIQVCTFEKGPYVWRPKHSHVYYVEFKDRLENKKSAYFYFGPFNGRENTWDNP